jgi:hypothetical protein
MLSRPTPLQIPQTPVNTYLGLQKQKTEQQPIESEGYAENNAGEDGEQRCW